MAAMDPLVICPYDPAHEILKSRLQFHLVRCAKNHEFQDKEVCPYNAVHIIDKIHFQDHLVTCPDYREVQSFRFKTDDKELHGIVSMDEVAQAHSRPVIGEEDWDNDVYHQTYDPIKNSEGKPLVRSLIGASKAKRREFRMRERMRMAQFVDEKPTPESSEVKPDAKKSNEPLRPPKTTNIEEEGKSKQVPLRAPKNLTTPSGEENQKGSAHVDTNLKFIPEEGPKPDVPGGRKDSKSCEKLQIPKRKPNLNSPIATKPSLESEMSKLNIKNDSGALTSGKSQDPQMKNTTANAEQQRKIGRCAAIFK
ncbi:gametocyte-specific factor 1 homolog [Diachasma alloeum]|uniref:gametocyte-specific factor 1 homolog n=1 Tax=Diachasma alloeum TaxID=454923 RepID=UPI00073819C9|nr:gametocyte-specific factor 1 homolog [Diachasma alloeum]